MGVLSSLISAGTSLLGGIMGQSAADKQMAMQKKFAQNAIQWKVADAKAAGVHPLYALGANTISYQPSSVGSDLASGLSAMGQDVSRAVEAVQSAPERNASKALTMLQLERARLENESLKADIAGKVNTNIRNAQVGPAMPSMDRITPPTRTPGFNSPLGWIEFDPNMSDLGQIFENRYGEGPAEWVSSVLGMVNDARYNMWNSLSPWTQDQLRRADLWVRKYNPMKVYP